MRTEKVLKKAKGVKNRAYRNFVVWSDGSQIGPIKATQDGQKYCNFPLWYC